MGAIGGGEGDVLRTDWYQRRRRAHRHRGAAIVEAGLIFPLLMFLVFGIMEIGHLIGAYSSAANGVRAGGRMASVRGNLGNADQSTLERMAEETTAIRNGEIEYIIIWHAQRPDEEVPAACVAVAEGLGAPNTRSEGVAGLCNVYARPQAPVTGAFAVASDQDAMDSFGCTDMSQAGSRLDCNWQPWTRRTFISPRCRTSPCPPRVEPDLIGVHIRLEYRYLTGLLGATRTITDSSITLLEPDNYELTGS